MIGEPTFSAWRDSPDFGALMPRPATWPRCGRALRAIEQDLARSDPDLLRLFQFFTRLLEGEQMPGTERVSRWVAWLPPRLSRPVVRLARPMARLGRHVVRLGRGAAKLGRGTAKQGRRTARWRGGVSRDW